MKDTFGMLISRMDMIEGKTLWTWLYINGNFPNWDARRGNNNNNNNNPQTQKTQRPTVPF